jgi:DNA-binding response OmpR family regulator
LPSVPCTLPAGPHGDILAGIIQQLRLENEIAPHVYMRDDLIVDHGRGQVWFQGVLLTELNAGTHPFKLLDLLAKSPGRIVSKQSINDALSESRGDDEVAKKAKLALIKAIKDSFTGAGRAEPADLGKIIAPKNGGYVLQTTARVLA